MIKTTLTAAIMALLLTDSNGSSLRRLTEASSKDARRLIQISYNDKYCVDYGTAFDWLTPYGGDYTYKGMVNGKPSYEMTICKDPNNCGKKGAILSVDTNGKWNFGAAIDGIIRDPICNVVVATPDLCTNWWPTDRNPIIRACGTQQVGDNGVAASPTSPPTSAGPPTPPPTSPSANNAPITITAADKTYLVQQHNNFRSQVAKGSAVGRTGNLPKAAKMYEASWDQTIADGAQAWANQCKQIHDPNGGFAENIIWGYNNVDPLKDATRSWFSEIERYTYGQVGEPFGVVGHFTNVIGERHTRIGCGFAHCPETPHRWTVNGNTYVLPYWFICRYGSTSGLPSGDSPYTTTGTTGDQCGNFNLDSSSGLCQIAS